MAEWMVVLLKIAAMFLVIVVGYLLRRGGVIDAEFTSRMSRLAIDFAFPALVFSQMVRTICPGKLGSLWFVPLVGACLICVGKLVGLAAAVLFGRRESRRTFIFLVGVMNWVYLPLPIAEGLFGDDGVCLVLLSNVGAQATLWTVGIWTLKRGGLDRDSLRTLLTNPGILATAAGVVTALVAPGLERYESLPALPARVILDAATALGSLTVPVSLLVTGSQLGGLEKTASGVGTKEVLAVVVTRLVVAPLATVLLVRLMVMAGVGLPQVPRMIAYIITAMPVAVSCSIFAERFGADTHLTAKAIFWSSLASVVTVPAFFFAVSRLGL